MDTVNFLGISIVGQSNQGGDGGIYVGSIMKGGAVALDGRIEPGDMILQVNDINFENMSNDDAVRVLRDVVQKPGPIKVSLGNNIKYIFHILTIFSLLWPNVGILTPRITSQFLAQNLSDQLIQVSESFSKLMKFNNNNYRSLGCPHGSSTRTGDTSISRSRRWARCGRISRRCRRCGRCRWRSWIDRVWTESSECEHPDQ